MQEKYVPIVLATLLFIPIALIIAIALLIGLNLNWIIGKDALLIALLGFLGFLLMTLQLQSYTQKKLAEGQHTP